MVTLPADAENKTITWLFNNNTIARKQSGEKPSVYDMKNYRLMDNGNLIIQKMTLFLEGSYRRLVGYDPTPLKFDVKVEVEVIEFENTYKEKILDGVIHREWNIKFNVSTGRVEDCKKEINEMKLCSKRPDSLQCTDITNATIVATRGACEAKIMYNVSLQYYVKFLPIDSHDFTPGEKSHEASYDEHLLKTVE
ncbi:Hypothetical predicted protein, partial [Paramuricea clavata]